MQRFSDKVAIRPFGAFYVHGARRHTLLKGTA